MPTDTATPAPPAQLPLFPVDPSAAMPFSFQAVWVDPSTACQLAPAGIPSWSGSVQFLPTAACQAAAAAERHGEAWLVASDGSYCHVDATGAVTPLSGWATAAARVIHQRKATAA